jgi:hypothetical protein
MNWEIEQVWKGIIMILNSQMKAGLMHNRHAMTAAYQAGAETATVF